MKRIFVAAKIAPTPDIINLFNQLKASLNKDKIKWVEPGNIHLTLKFFGETPDDIITEIIKALATIKHTTNINFTLGGTGIFGSTYQPRVIWLKINDSNGFQTLAGKINEAILPLGFIPDRQNFVPHLTLGRINFLNDKKYFQDIINKYKTFSSEPQMVSEYHLFESKLKPTGPEYTIIKTYPIGNY